VNDRHIARGLWALTIGMLTASGLSGCIVPLAVGAAAGVGVVKYNEGELASSIPGRLGDQVWPAAIQLAEDRHWKVTSQRPGPDEAFLRAETEFGRQVEITFKRRGGDFTGISIRVGTFGDEVESKKILEEIKARVKA